MLLAAYRWFVNKRKVKDMILKAVDNFWTFIGMVILVILMLVSIPFILIMEWLSD